MSFWFCVAYGTKVGEIYGEGRTEFEVPNFRRWAQNVIGLLKKGEDPLDIWAQRAHELGMEFWPAMRMNDIHHDWVENWPSLRSKWAMERPHLIIGRRIGLLQATLSAGGQAVGRFQLGLRLCAPGSSRQEVCAGRGDVR